MSPQVTRNLQLKSWAGLGHTLHKNTCRWVTGKIKTEKSTFIMPTVSGMEFIQMTHYMSRAGQLRTCGSISSTQCSNHLFTPTSILLIWSILRALFHMKKSPGHGVDQSLPFRANVKNARNCTSIHTHVFMAWCLMKCNNDFYVLNCPQALVYWIHVSDTGFTGRFRQRVVSLLTACSQNCEKWLLTSSCLSVCLSSWNNSAPTG